MNFCPLSTNARVYGKSEADSEFLHNERQVLLIALCSDSHWHRVSIANSTPPDSTPLSEWKLGSILLFFNKCLNMSPRPGCNYSAAVAHVLWEGEGERGRKRSVGAGGKYACKKRRRGPLVAE